jgi:outer membrane protein assembly factor BamB
MRTRLLLILSLAPWAPGMAGGQEHWNQFRGPGGRGVAPDDAELPAVLDRDGNLEWERELPPGNSSPCIWGERVFVTGCADGELTTLCIDRSDGTVAWRRALPAVELEPSHRINGPASPTPATDGERVYVYFGSAGLLCYDLAGELVWHRDTAAPENTFGTAASPIVAGGLLVFVRDSNADSYVEALHPETGETAWKRERAGFRLFWSTPAVWERDGALELLVNGAWWLTAYDLADGSERWSVPGLTDEPIVTPTTGGGLVFVSSYNMKTNPEVIGLPTFAQLLARHDTNADGALSREEAEANQSVLSRHDADGEGDHPLRIFFNFLDEDRDGALTEAEWQKLVAWLDGFEYANAVMALRPPGGDDREGTKIAWQHSSGVPECPSPLYYRGRIHTVKNGGLASCLDAATGALHYLERLDSRGPHYASPVAGDGKVYAASAHGVVTVFTASDAVEVLARNDLGERIMATPALQGGRVYVRTERALYAFGPGG